MLSISPGDCFGFFERQIAGMAMSNLYSKISTKPVKRMQENMSVSQTNAWMNGMKIWHLFKGVQCSAQTLFIIAFVYVYAKRKLVVYNYAKGETLF